MSDRKHLRRLLAPRWSTGRLFGGRQNRCTEDDTLAPEDARFTERFRDLRQMINGEWIPDILVALSEGPAQYSVVLSRVRERTKNDGWTSRRRHLQESILTRTLRRMEQRELITHEREDSFPYHAHYRLTPAAVELLTAVAPFVSWAERHTDLVERARARHRANAAGTG
ncbi:winged helix-turn-helix transcriptional regulator [Streptomyces sp. NPDC059009]|uniref:winged helix-turn-helix transcriptional regulator n=1 Tax=Streptomyces sp. NPDC059009 TaxID=3346694 RepID=UPI0036AD0145